MGQRPSERHTIYFNLNDALRQPGCAFCTLVILRVAKFLDDLLYERVNDPGVRQELREAQGFCHRHAWELCRIHANFGVGVIYQDLLERAIAALRPEQGEVVTKHQAHPTLCPACQTAQEVAGRYAEAFLESFMEAEFSSALKQSEGLCLPHYTEVLSRCREPSKRSVLTRWELEKLSELQGKLKEFLRKQDYRYQAEGLREGEGTSWLRAVEMFVGKPSQPEGEINAAGE